MIRSQIKQSKISDQSTKQRQRRFSRTSNRDNSRSNSTKSNHNKQSSSPLNKFYIKNISNKLINTNSQLTNFLSYSHSHPHPHSHTTTTTNNYINNQQQQLYQKNRIITNLQNQIVILKKQIKKNHQYLKKNKNNNKDDDQRQRNVGREMLELRKVLQEEVSKNWKLERENLMLGNRIDQMQVQIAKLQKNKKSCYDLKKSIILSRLQEYEQQISTLKSENQQLKKTIKQLHSNPNPHTTPPTTLHTNFSKNPHITSQIDPPNSIQASLQQKLQKQLQNLYLKHNMQLMQAHKQILQLKNNKDRQYSKLKNQFLEYVRKHQQSCCFRGKKMGGSPIRFFQVQLDDVKEEQQSLDISVSEDNQQN